MFYDRYNDEVALARSIARASDKEALKKCKKSRAKASKSKKDKELSSSSGDKQEKAPLEQLLHHLRSFEGGARKQIIGTDHVRRAGRLLHEVDDAPKSVKKTLAEFSNEQNKEQLFRWQRPAG